MFTHTYRKLASIVHGTLNVIPSSLNRVTEGPANLVAGGTRFTTMSVGVHLGSWEKDFGRNLLNALGFRLDAFSVPVSVVIKKNKRILENLEKWLSDFNANQRGTIDTG